MSGKYGPEDLTTYGAEDDEELDMILDALERANRTSAPDDEKA